MKKPVYNKSAEETALFTELRKRVNERVKAIPGNRDNIIKVKVFVLPLLYLGCYLAAVFNGANPVIYASFFAAMGIILVLIYLNLIHEAAHNNIFKNKKYNKAVLRIFDFIGANSFIWERRHIVSHHSYPNVDGWDSTGFSSWSIRCTYLTGCLFATSATFSIGTASSRKCRRVFPEKKK